MLDFLIISTRKNKRGITEIYPRFRMYPKSTDLMIRGGDFYAIWLEDIGLWSTDEQDALRLIDRELDIFKKEYENRYDCEASVMYMWDSESGMIDSWHKYCQKQMRDSFNPLDEKLIFSNTITKKSDYASKKLPYPLEPGECPSYEKLISTLYSETERHKIEWAIGSIVTGDSKLLQKFLVLYGAAGTGKSTILNIIQQLFEGYYSVFDAKALGSSSNAFALEAFKSGPLVAIQHDGDLSRIEDNTRINSLVSHELMTVNEKFKSQYSNRFKCFLFMGTNKPVKITDGRSGLIRRLIDVSPSGAKLNAKEYKAVVKQIPFELGAIASHCKEVYLKDPGAYDDYIPITMLSASNDFYNFVIDSYSVFKKEDGTTLKASWEMYKTYCDDAKVPYPLTKKSFKEELKNYFKEFTERVVASDGTRIRSYYSGFRTDKFEEDTPTKENASPEPTHYSIIFKEQHSILDDVCSNCYAQYATTNETPFKEWDSVKTKLSDLDTSKLHYVKVPENHIVIDFDIKNKDGSKSLERNIEEASKWPKTYAELSKSGGGIHLHYIYNGDVTKLSKVYSDNIEIKVFTGKSTLRRLLTKCNNLPIATISSGLPLKGENKMINFEAVKSEKGLRTLIKRNLNKEIHPGTKPSIDFIFKILDDAYKSGLKYDVSDMKNDVFAFAANSTHKADYCIKLVNKMPFKSDESSDATVNNEAPIVFYDTEVFPNLFLINWKFQGNDKPIARMINPTAAEVEDILKFRLVGFNCRRYDNHMLYGRLIGYSNEELYNLSQKIINGERNAFFGEAYNVSYTDIYDFSSTKQSLKKFEIDLGIHHKELGLPWDQPVPEERWLEVAEYCDNDVIATEAVFNARQADFTARCILADIAGLTVNDTTNTLTTKIIFGNNRKPQDQFCYRNMGDTSVKANRWVFVNHEVFGEDYCDEFSLFDDQSRPVFPGYKFDRGVSTYRGEEVGEGGYVYAEPGMYTNVALLDVASMHPHSIIAENLFGDIYTARFKELVEARIAVKHEEWDQAKSMLDGKLALYVQKVIDGELTSKDLANALKIAINSVYGLTTASFEHPFRDPRNVDNIVAKRGALFMINLKHAVQDRGFTVAHIKTDSIKIHNATPEIIQFVMDYGKMYGYNFEHEATYDRMCLVNDSVYIARYQDGKWTATGTQFQVPYVFKKLFSKEDITFEDMCETRSVKSAMYLDMNEGLPDASDKEKLVDKYTKSLKKLDPESQEAKNLIKNISALSKTVAEGHDYKFVGKVGQFCPVNPGCGGGLLMREQNGKYYAVTGTSGYRWLESETVRLIGAENNIDRRYYDGLVDAAVESISKYGDFEWFVSGDAEMAPWTKSGEPHETDDLPWDD